jgi:predicted GNAT family N-acyltransferase
MEVLYKNYLISDDKSMIDSEVVIELLSKSYWANKRPYELTRKGIENSYCLGVYSEGQQIGFARIITDYATFYYLCDVIIHQDHRGKGIGNKLIELIVDNKEFEDMTGVLGTRDAHSLNEKFGFIRDGERFLRKPPKYIVAEEMKRGNEREHRCIFTEDR